jgi:uncharacterized protein (TIGR04552 family)
MERPSYLQKYMFDWEMLDVVVGGKSALDTKNFLGPMSTIEQVNQFLKGYGLDPMSLRPSYLEIFRKPSNSSSAIF